MLAEGKKVMPADVMASSYKRFLAKKDPPLSLPTVKAAKAREKAGTACQVAIKDLSGHLPNRK